MTQNEQIHEALRRGPLTALSAIELGCLRLAARIHDLRSEGVDIETVNIKRGDKTFAEYRLV